MLPLPPARRPGRYDVELVCLGNICRSPTAHVVLEDRLAAAGLDDVVAVSSSGTGGWHVGEPMDPRAAGVLDDAGFDPSRHRARQHDVDRDPGPDLVLAMDAANRRDLLDAGVDAERLALLRDLDPDPAGRGEDVPDPWAGGPEGFAHVLELVERSCDALVTALAAQRPWDADSAGPQSRLAGSPA